MNRILTATLAGIAGIVLTLGGCQAVLAQQKTRTGLEIGAQQGIGLRFGSSFNHFFRPADHPATNGLFSNGVLGLTYKFYERFGHIELGAALGHKEQEGGFGFPIVMEDFNDSLNTSFTYFAAEIKVGPRVFWYFHPKFGISTGFRSKMSGLYQQDEDARPNERIEQNAFFLNLPIGFSIELPTSFGTTGFAAYYEIGVTNTLNQPELFNADPKRLHNFNFEIHVLLRTK
jgi:hypothetical protein